MNKTYNVWYNGHTYLISFAKIGDGFYAHVNDVPFQFDKKQDDVIPWKYVGGMPPTIEHVRMRFAIPDAYDRWLSDLVTR